MPEFFLELFSEEIPAGLQGKAMLELEHYCSFALHELNYKSVDRYWGPRHLGLSATIAEMKPERVVEARGPRDNASDNAISGFLRKFNANKSELTIIDGYFWIRRTEKAVPAVDVIMSKLPEHIVKIEWPKRMRWGQSGGFSWIRPLRRIVCLVDGNVIPITVGPITASNESEGHRFLSRGSFVVSSFNDCKQKLRERHVIADQNERANLINAGLDAKAAELGLTIAQDNSLLSEVIGLVEFPVPLIGRIDKDFMLLPPEVRELSMKVNQRYFALRDSDGKPAPHFAFVSNMESEDGGAAIIAGNERVLRARLSDARHFWDLDLKTPLNELLPKLDKITFHAKIGTQGDRVNRISALAKRLATTLGADHETALQAEWAGRLSKADLVTGMVGEFPELQGIIGGYYAEKMPRGWNGSVVGPAIATHYQPKGPSDKVPVGTVAVSVALADKLDTLIEFFRADEKPSGSGDPYALRRAALGVIRIILENGLSEIDLGNDLIDSEELLAFLFDRLKVKLRGEQKRFDVLDAVFAVSADGNLVRLMKRVTALSEMLDTEDGKNLHAAYKRAANILRVEDPKKNISTFLPKAELFKMSEEWSLAETLNAVRAGILEGSLEKYELYKDIMQRLASLRPAVDLFFEKVTVNHATPEIRQNRLQLLAQFCETVHLIADFSKIEG